MRRRGRPRGEPEEAPRRNVPGQDAGAAGNVQQGQEPSTAQILATMATAMNTIAQFVVQQGTAGTGRGDQTARAEGSGTAGGNLFDKFLHHGAYSFYGEPDDMKAELWLSKFEKVAAILECDDERKINCASFLMEGDAEAWWRTIREKWDAERVQHVWADFVREFRDKYVSVVARERHQDEFIALKQGNMTVDQYEATFTRLSRYVPALVQPEDVKIQRFITGLRSDIMLNLSSQDYPSYAAVVRAASRYEKRKADVLAQSSQSSKRQFQSQSQGYQRQTQQPRQTQSYPGPVQVQSQPRPAQSQPQGQSQTRPVTARSQQGSSATSTYRTPTGGAAARKNLQCTHCNRKGHTEAECWRKLGRCTGCGSDQHRVRDCPKFKFGPGQTSGQGGQTRASGAATVPRGQARVFALDQEELPETTVVVEGEAEVNPQLLEVEEEEEVQVDQNQ